MGGRGSDGGGRGARAKGRGRHPTAGAGRNFHHGREELRGRIEARAADRDDRPPALFRAAGTAGRGRRRPAHPARALGAGRLCPGGAERRHHSRRQPPRRSTPVLGAHVRPQLSPRLYRRYSSHSFSRIAGILFRHRRLADLARDDVVVASVPDVRGNTRGVALLLGRRTLRRGRDVATAAGAIRLRGAGGLVLRAVPALASPPFSARASDVLFVDPPADAVPPAELPLPSPSPPAPPPAPPAPPPCSARLAATSCCSLRSMASNFASEVWRSPSSVSRCSSGVFAPARSPALPDVPDGCPGLAAPSEGPVALLSAELLAPLSAGLPAAFSAEVEEGVAAAVAAPADGIAGIWLVLRAAQPASQEEATIVTTIDALLPISCIPLGTY